MNILLGLILIVGGILNLTIPSEMIRFNHMFTFKRGAEPTEIAIFMTRISGVFIIIIGFVLLFMW